MKSITLATLALLLCPLGLLAQPPWQHGKLQISENGHAIQHTDGTPFLWIGDTGWGMFQQLTREEVDLYLDNRQQLGFTVIQSVVFWYPHGGGIKSGPHNAANAYGHRPFSGGEDTPNTAEPLLVKGGSPTAPNDYWDHVDYIIAAIRKRNMYVALLPCWGRAYITPQFGGAHQEFTEEEARAYGAFLGKRYQQEPHILWVLGGDAKAQKKGYDQNNTYQDWDMRGTFRVMAEGIAQGLTGQQPAWNQAHPAWKEVFMTYHPDGNPGANSSDWFHEDAWLTANGVEVWREVDQVYPMMLQEYQLDKPIKPSLFLEGSYEFGSYRHECGWVTPVKTRRQIYHTFFGGGAGHTYGASPIWPMRGSGGDYSCGYTWQQALAFPGAVQFAGVAKAFLRKHQWSAWIPDQRMVNGVTGEGESLKTAVRLESGNMALVYFSNHSQAQIKNTLGKAVEAHWFDPRDGQEAQAGSFQLNELRDMIPPNGWEDAILVLEVSENASGQLPPVQSGVYKWADHPVRPGELRESRKILEGSSPHFDYLRIHATTQFPGAKPSTAHANAEHEECIIVKEGRMKVTIEGQSRILEAGGVILLMPQEMHSLENVGKTNLTYYVMKYRSKKKMEIERGQASGGSLMLYADSLTFKPSARGGGRAYFDRATAMCERFEMHVTQLNQKGPSHEPHAHVETEIILVISGETEMTIDGKEYTGKAGDFYWMNSQSLHGVRNASDAPCSYFAFKWR